MREIRSFQIADPDNSRNENELKGELIESPSVRAAPNPPPRPTINHGHTKRIHLEGSDFTRKLLDLSLSLSLFGPSISRLRIVSGNSSLRRTLRRWGETEFFGGKSSLPREGDDSELTLEMLTRKFTHIIEIQMIFL